MREFLFRGAGLLKMCCKSFRFSQGIGGMQWLVLVGIITKALGGSLVWIGVGPVVRYNKSSRFHCETSRLTRKSSRYPTKSSHLTKNVNHEHTTSTSSTKKERKPHAISSPSIYSLLFLPSINTGLDKYLIRSMIRAAFNFSSSPRWL